MLFLPPAVVAFATSAPALAFMARAQRAQRPDYDENGEILKWSLVPADVTKFLKDMVEGDQLENRTPSELKALFPNQFGKINNALLSNKISQLKRSMKKRVVKSVESKCCVV